MVVLTLLVLSHFEDQRIQPLSDPANCPVLFRDVQTLVKIVRMTKDLLCFLKTDARLGFSRNCRLFRPSKWKRILV